MDSNCWSQGRRGGEALIFFVHFYGKVERIELKMEARTSNIWSTSRKMAIFAIFLLVDHIFEVRAPLKTLFEKFLPSHKNERRRALFIYVFPPLLHRRKREGAESRELAHPPPLAAYKSNGYFLTDKWWFTMETIFYKKLNSQKTGKELTKKERVVFSWFYNKGLGLFENTHNFFVFYQ